MQVNKRISILLVGLFLALLSLQAFYPPILLAQTPVPTEPPLRTFTAPPALTARAAFAIDSDTGRVLFNKESSNRLPMASTTKIMTALTLFDVPNLNLEDTAIVIKDDLVGEANMGLQVGMRVKIITLLYGLMLASANDAGMTLARYAGSKLPGNDEPIKKFTNRMNTLAGKLGLKNSNFTNPHGLDEDTHYSSAEDLAIAGWYAMQNKTIASIVRLSEANINGTSFYNITNFIRRYPGANGIKPGETDKAGLCIVASANRYRRNAIVVLLNSPGMRTESDLLMDYAFNQIFAGNNPTGSTPPVTATLTQTSPPTLNPTATVAPVIVSRNEYIGLPLGDRLLPFRNEATRNVVLDNFEMYLPQFIGKP